VTLRRLQSFGAAGNTFYRESQVKKKKKKVTNPAVTQSGWAKTDRRQKQVSKKEEKAALQISKTRKISDAKNEWDSRGGRDAPRPTLKKKEVQTTGSNVGGETKGRLPTR